MSNLEYLPKSKRTRVGLVGFGKTGRAVASTLLHDKTLDLVWVVRKTRKMEARSVPEFLGIDSDEDGLIHWIGDVDFESLQESSPVDAIVDFSSEEGMDYYGDSAAELGITIVSAISALPENRIKKLESYGSTTRVLWSPNITLGINFLMSAAQTLQKIAPDADISILEEHFKEKPETSGTALKIADALGVDHNRINTVRAGGIIGVHEVLFGFPFQTVRIKHESISREAFGNGARFALREISKREFGFYRMENLIGKYFVDVNKIHSPDEKIEDKRKIDFLARLTSRLERILKRN